MQRKEFENRIKSLLPKAADDVVESWAEYATELDQDGTEAAADFYDKNYIALLLALMVIWGLALALAGPALLKFCILYLFG